jgi:PAS domain S-box-containing protein
MNVKHVVGRDGEQMPFDPLSEFRAQVLEMIATRQPLAETLNFIAKSVEDRCDDVRCSIAFVDAELRFHVAVAPNLPAEYCCALDGVPVYPYIGPCGLAAHRKERIISESIETDARWTDDFRAFTKGLGLQACWSTPALDSHGKVIGTVALYSLQPGVPDPRHLELMEIVPRLVGIAIERQVQEERSQLYAEIIARSSEAVRILDPKGKIAEQNAAHRELFGIADEDLLGKTSAVIFGEESFRGISTCISAGTVFSDELSVTAKGQQRIIDVSVFPIRGENSRIICFASINRDVTETRKIQEALQQLNSELEKRVEDRTTQLRRLSAKLMTAHDDERRRIARDLHDSAGQYLAAVQMNLSALQKSPKMPDSDKIRILDSMEIVDRCTSEIRTISYLLHPPLLEEMGLESAILTYVDGFSQRSEIQVEVEIPTGLRRLPSEIETALFRVIQQGLANIHRHSASTTGKIIVHELRNGIAVEVSDAGDGIPADKLADFRSGKKLFGVGLAGMRERVVDLGGEFSIASDPSGTAIRISLPIPPAITATPSHSSYGTGAGLGDFAL